MPNIGDYVEIRWQDAIHIPHGWQLSDWYRDRAETFEQRPHVTVGILLDHKPSYYVVALSKAIAWDNAPEFTNLAQVIHDNMIISIKKLYYADE